MKRFVCIILTVVCVFLFNGCVDHDDGVCDYKGCNMTIGVIRYDKNHEFCLEHAHEEGLI